MITDAIMCDLDGTISLLNGRSPYKAETCNEDLVNEPVAKLVDAMYSQGYAIIFLSGREDKYRPQTLEFLDKAVKCARDWQHLLYMRETGDFRKDSIVKRELFINNVQSKWKVLFVLDDRQQVVDMWRDECGLTCFQVAKGDF